MHRGHQENGMTGFSSLCAAAISLPDDDVDTDIIYPARFLLITRRDGLARHAFADRVADGDDRIGGGRGAAIIIAGRNFGCGSSREHAVWALAGLGVKAIFAPSFGEIFRANCTNNGIVSGIVDGGSITSLHAAADAGEELRVDLADLTVTWSGGKVLFDIGAAEQESLLNGWNETTRILAIYSRQIEVFEQRQRVQAPWLWANETEQEISESV
jgi:3-isopropylmalate dehydratase small subunit